MKPIQTPGAISWPELITSDREGAVAFYQAVFGWEIQTMPMSAGMYSVGNVAGQPVGGMMDRPEESIPPNWSVYITVEDVDATVAKAVELGATVIMEPFTAEEVGTFAVLQDPQGAFFSLMAYLEPEHEAHQREWNDNFTLHGGFSWYELRCPDAGAAASFYEALFGWSMDEQQMGMGPYHVFNVAGDSQGGILTVDPKEMPPHWGCYITVDDVEAFNQAVADNGGQIAAPSIAVPGVGTFSMAADPQGAMFCGIQYETPEEG